MTQITLNLQNAQRITSNVTPTLTSAIYTSSKINIHTPEKCACVALAITWSFVELPLDTALELDSLMVQLDYHLDRVRRLNQDITLAGNASALVSVAKTLNLLVVNEDGTVQLTPKWNEMVLAKNVTLPATGKFDDANRLTNYVKGGKVKPSKLLKEAIQHLQATEYHVHGDMLNIIGQVIGRVKAMPMSDLRNSIMMELDGYGYILTGCETMKDEPILTSPYDADVRGRLYHEACAGANPQSSDLARSLYAHNVENFVSKYQTHAVETGAGVETTESYNMFLDELDDCAGGKKFQDSKYLMRVANNPIEFLFQSLKKSLSTDLATRQDCPKKPFTLVRMALDFADFENTGKCDSRLGFGLDARCSGTQYFAILAGDAEMGEATGITTKPKSETTDPYVMSAKKLLEKFGYDFASRSFIKTPYMAVQYGGGERALLTSKDNLQNLRDAGILSNDMQQVAKDCIEAINEAMGVKINNLKTTVQDTLKVNLELAGKEYITYRHTDGLQVFKPAKPTIEVCPSFSLFLGAGKRMHFGKAEGSWTVKAAQPTAEEYVRTFLVNYIQGLDALVARTVIVHAKKAGLKAFTSIHDCFRTTLLDAPKLKAVIASAYKEVFIDNDQHVHLMKILGRPVMPQYTPIVTEEILNHKDSSYFCA